MLVPLSKNIQKGSAVICDSMHEVAPPLPPPPYLPPPPLPPPPTFGSLRSTRGASPHTPLK